MSVIPTQAETEYWAGVLERRFIAAAQSEDAYAAAARTAHQQAVEWANHDSDIKGGFLWVCDLLGLEPDAVRRAMKVRKEDTKA